MRNDPDAGAGPSREEIESAPGSRAAQTVELPLVKPIRPRPAGKHKTRVTTDQWVLGEGTAGMLAAIVNASDAAIINKTLDGIVTSWNRGAERIFGYTASEMIGQPIHVIAAPKRPKEMVRNLERIRRGQLVDHYETERKQKCGKIIQISLAVSPIYDKRGCVVGACKIARDITAQKITEAHLKAKSEQLEEFAHILDLAPAMVRTLEGKILHWGRGLQSLYGWSPEEAIGRSSQKLLSTTFPKPLPEIQTEFLDRGEWHGELLHTHRDGHRLVVASQWVLHRSSNGNAVSIVEIGTDVTEAKRAQSAIEEREARLRSIFETAPDAIITIDEAGIIQYFGTSAERLFGYGAGEVVGRNLNMLMPSPHRERHDGYIARYLRTGEKRIIGIGRQVEGQRKDGTTFPMQLAVGEVRLGDAHIFSGFISDLTPRVRMEQQLREAQKMEAIGQLTGGVAHDFNNLLTVISGNLEILERRLKDVEHREILEEAQEASQLGADLAKRLLAFGRRQSLQPKPTNLNALAGGMFELLRRSLGEMVEIEIRLAKELSMTTVDPGQVESALLNLALNARDAMPKGGRLLIETAEAQLDADYAAAHPDSAPGNYVVLTVTDTGTGMTQEVRDRAFEPFYTTKAPGAGSGLGLSMVYGFVKQSGGHVQLYSELGHGTAVRVYLPARSDDAGPAEQRVAISIARPALGETILVVEDDQRVRRVSVRRVKELGYVVIEAESGAAALRVLDQGEPIDLLFTDIVMAGGMTGLDLVHEARRRRPDLKILLTSGYAEPAVINGGLSTTNAGWLGKPYSVSDLQTKLRELLDH